jgi:hypothetical protein
LARHKNWQILTCRLQRTVLSFADEEKGHLAFLQELIKSRGSTFVEDNKVSSKELPWMMDLTVIRAATDNFSVSNKLGQGGFGPVYKVSNTSALFFMCLQRILDC